MASDHQGRRPRRYRFRKRNQARIYHTRNTAIPKGIGQGQITATGTLARPNALGGAMVHPAVLSIPDGISGDSLRLGMSGSATAFAATPA